MKTLKNKKIMKTNKPKKHLISYYYSDEYNINYRVLRYYNYFPYLGDISITEIKQYVDIISGNIKRELNYITAFNIPELLELGDLKQELKHKEREIERLEGELYDIQRKEYY